MRLMLIATTATLFTFLAGNAHAGVYEPVFWNNGTTGKIGDIDVTLSNHNANQLGAGNFSGTDFSGAPLSSNQSYANIAANANWTVTFSTPVSDLNVYAYLWRGQTSGSGLTFGSPITHEFSESFTILSGFTGATVSGNTLSYNAGTSGAWQNGILQFSGPVSSLSVTTNLENTNLQGLTFSADPSASSGPAAVPEPSTLALAVLCSSVAGVRAMRRRGRKSEEH